MKILVLFGIIGICLFGGCIKSDFDLCFNKCVQINYQNSSINGCYILYHSELRDLKFVSKNCYLNHSQIFFIQNKCLNLCGYKSGIK